MPIEEHSSLGETILEDRVPVGGRHGICIQLFHPPRCYEAMTTSIVGANEKSLDLAYNAVMYQSFPRLCKIYRSGEDLDCF